MPISTLKPVIKIVILKLNKTVTTHHYFCIIMKVIYPFKSSSITQSKRHLGRSLPACCYS